MGKQIKYNDGNKYFKRAKILEKEITEIYLLLDNWQLSTSKKITTNNEWNEDYGMPNNLKMAMALVYRNSMDTHGRVFWKLSWYSYWSNQGRNQDFNFMVRTFLTRARIFFLATLCNPPCTLAHTHCITSKFFTSIILHKSLIHSQLAVC